VPRVFINYRTEDEVFAASLLDTQLSAEFGADRVFLASRSIPPGHDFEQDILGRLQECTVLVAVIGQRWLDPHAAARLADPADWVRRELLAARAAGIAVVPVLVDGRPRLRPAQLPAELEWLARLQYLKLRHRHTSDDIRRIVTALRELDDGLTSVVEEDLRAYLEALAAELLKTQSWMPYHRLDDAFLERAVSVHRAMPAVAADETMHGRGSDLLVGEVPWAAAVREVPIGVVLGDAGYGKTWLLRRHCLQLCWAALDQLASGADLAEIAPPLLVHAHQLAAGWRAGHRPREILLDAVLPRLKAPIRDENRFRAFMAERLDPDAPVSHVLIDAYDEVFDDELRDDLAEAVGWLTGLVRVGRGPQLLLSSRPSGFDDPFRALVEDDADDGDDQGIDPDVDYVEELDRDLDVPTVRYLSLGVLDEHQVRRLWARWFELRGWPVPQQRLDPVLAPGSAIRQAARMPLIAAFCAWVAETETVTPHRSGLYGQVVDRFLGLHWKVGAPSVMTTIRQDEALRARFRAAFTELAWTMATGAQDWRDSIPVSDCEAVLDGAMGGLARSSSRTFDAVRGFGILVLLGAELPGAPTPVAWIHRSVHQFLAAQRLVTLAEADIADIVADRCWFRPEWRDVLDFAIGLEAGSGPRARGAVQSASEQEYSLPGPLRMIARMPGRCAGCSDDLSRATSGQPSSQRPVRPPGATVGFGHWAGDRAAGR
jgi:hypothetical protein